MNYSNKKIAIIGAGESGVGAALLAKSKGCTVFVSDGKSIKEAFRKELEFANIEFEEKKHNLEKLKSFDVIVKSPGVPDSIDVMQQLLSDSKPVISEIEFAASFSDAKIVGITGTNGKTTTTKLVFSILQQAGFDVGIGGNIGKSFARQLAEKDHEYWVLEVSSFQLDNIKHFKNHIGILLNISEDHLDRYDYDMEKYIAAKLRIALNQGPNDYLIYNYDDPIIKERVKNLNPAHQLIPLSQNEKLKSGCWIDSNKLKVKIKKEEIELMEKDELGLKGKHNRYNSMAAGVVGKILQIRKETIRDSLKNFENVEHRLESVATIKNVEFINDSKATNVNATWYALESMKTSTVWIAGGIDKGNDYNELMDLVKSRVKALVCLGKDNRKLISAFENTIEYITEAKNMNEAVKQAAALCKSGDAVLLSPACASFDLFDSYEDRGMQFKKEVKSL